MWGRSAILGCESLTPKVWVLWEDRQRESVDGFGHGCGG